MGSRERILGALEGLPEVRFATLFGSRAEAGAARPDSDWDIAVYLDESADPKTRESVRSRLIAELEPAVRVDVVILNEAPALLAHRALCGDRLVIRDRPAWVRFFVRTLAAANDEAYWRDLHARERARRLEEGRFGRP